MKLLSIKKEIIYRFERTPSQFQDEHELFRIKLQVLQERFGSGAENRRADKLLLKKYGI